MTYAFLYSDVADAALGEGRSKGTVTFATRGAPYLYDAWTGAYSPVRVCRHSREGTTIDFSLAGNQSIIVVFRHDEDPHCQFTKLGEGLSVHESPIPGELLLQNCNTRNVLVRHDGSTLHLPAAATSWTLNEWTLVVESWLPPNRTHEAYHAYKSNSTFATKYLRQWADISDSLRNVSGRGFYSASFEWPPSRGRADGAEIDLGWVLHTARVWINDQQLPPLDPVKPVGDITKYLKAGSNEVTIVVSTTFGGAVAAYWANVATAAVPASLTALPPREQPNGLVAPVKIVPYSNIRVASINDDLDSARDCSSAKADCLDEVRSFVPSTMTNFPRQTSSVNGYWAQKDAE